MSPSQMDLEGNISTEGEVKDFAPVGNKVRKKDATPSHCLFLLLLLLSLLKYPDLCRLHAEASQQHG